MTVNIVCTDVIKYCWLNILTGQDDEVHFIK